MAERGCCLEGVRLWLWRSPRTSSAARIGSVAGDISLHRYLVHTNGRRTQSNRCIQCQSTHTAIRFLTRKDRNRGGADWPWLYVCLHTSIHFHCRTEQRGSLALQTLLFNKKAPSIVRLSLCALGYNRYNFPCLFHPRVCRLLVLSRFRQFFAQALTVYQRADVVVLRSSKNDGTARAGTNQQTNARFIQNASRHLPRYSVDACKPPLRVPALSTPGRRKSMSSSRPTESGSNLPAALARHNHCSPRAQIIKTPLARHPAPPRVVPGASFSM